MTNTQELDKKYEDLDEQFEDMTIEELRHIISMAKQWLNFHRN